MPNYNKSVIYTIKCLDESINDMYVGATTQYALRKWQHKRNCTNPESRAHNYHVYTFIRNNGGWENWNMEPLEEVCCNDKMGLNIIERKYIEDLGSTLNKNIPGRTKAESDKAYREANKEILNEKKRQWHWDNRETILIKNKKYYDENRDIILEKDRQRNIRDKVKRNALSRQYHEANKERLKAKKQVKHTCACGTVYSHACKARHERSKKHIKYIESLNEN